MKRSQHQRTYRWPTLLIGAVLTISTQMSVGTRAQAAPPRAACNRARLNEERISDGVNYRCNMIVGSRGRRTYLWQRTLPTPVGPGGSTTTIGSGGGGSPVDIGTGDIACLALGNNRSSLWVNDDDLYWQSILNQKTGTTTENFINFTGGRKDVTFENGTLTLLGIFQGNAVRRDSRSPVILAYSRKSLILKVRTVGAALVIDDIIRNEIVTNLEINGTATTPIRTTERVSVGDRFPFKCTNNLLAITEQGLNGPVTTTYELRPSGS